MNNHLLLLIGIVFVSVAHAGYHELHNVEVLPGEELGYRYGIYNEEDSSSLSPLYTPIQSLAPQIDAQLTIMVDRLEPQTRVYVAITHTREYPRLGTLDKGSMNRCCTAETKEAQQCDNVGELIIEGELALIDGQSPADTSSAADPKYIYLHTIALTNYTQQLSVHHPIGVSGIWYLLVINCDDDLTVHLTGKIEMLNSFGYLGITEFPSLVFYSTGMYVYIVSTILWFIWCVVCFRYLFFLQAIIGSLFALGFAEMVLWYSELSFYNSLGVTSTLLTTLGILATSGKRTTTRVTVLLTAIGYGIELPTLPQGTLLKLVPLSLAYVCCAASLNALDIASRSHIKPNVFSAGLLIAVSLLDTIFYYWSILSLSVLLKKLSLKTTAKARAKYKLYRTLWWLLMFCAVFSLSLIVGQVVVVSATPQDDTWVALWWIRFALWDVGYYLLLVGVALLLRPSGDNQRYSPEQNLDEEIVLEPLVLPIGVEMMLEEVEDKTVLDVKAD